MISVHVFQGRDAVNLAKLRPLGAWEPAPRRCRHDPNPDEDFVRCKTKGSVIVEVRVNGKQIDIGDSLRSYVNDKLVSGVFKYFDRPVDAQVTFSRDGHEYRADCSVHLATGITLQAHSKASDIYASFDSATDRLEKRLRRYKRRLKDHHAARKEPVPVFEAPAYVIRTSDEPEEGPTDLNPTIIAEETASIRTLSVGEAVMEMELNDAPVIVFKDAKSQGISLVYRRSDGHIGWIDVAAQTEAVVSGAPAA